MRLADHSSRGVLPTVMCLVVTVKRPWPIEVCCAMGWGKGDTALS